MSEPSEDPLLSVPGPVEDLLIGAGTSIDLGQILEERRQARELLLSLLRAPWTRMSPWAISNVCAYLEHPSRIPEEPAPCPCGRFKESRPVELAEPE